MTTTHELFHVRAPSDGLELVLGQLPVGVHTEPIATRDALDRVLAEDVSAPADLPSFTRSTMDGFAVRAADTFGATEGLPAYLELIAEVVMGHAPEVTIAAGQCARIATGGMLPDGTDAIVMVEQTQEADPTTIEVLRPVAPGENVVQVGEDIHRGDSLLRRGHMLRPQDLGGLIGLGVTRVEVARRLRVGILSGGDELVEPDQVPGPGQIRDINSYTLAALVRRSGHEPYLAGVFPDDFATLQTAAREALASSDVLILSAGSSVSARDMTAEVIRSLGQPGVLVHGVSLKPGKPTILAVCDRKAVFGLPGNPVSCMVTFDLFVAPVLARLSGSGLPPRRSVIARLSHNVASAAGREDYIQVRLERRADGGFEAIPVFGKSNLIFTLVRAEGILKIPLDAGGLAAGATVEVVLFLSEASGGLRRDLYLQDIPLEEALDRFWRALARADALKPLPGEEVPIAAALGRVTAQAIFARMSVPHYHAAAMDGIAVRALNTLGASEAAPLRLHVGTQATWVDTGDPLPSDTNAVIMAENVQDGGDGTLEILAAVAPWQHVRQMGEDMVATELVLPENHRLSAVDLGAVVAAGHTRIQVRRQPRVAILPTGSELVEPGRPLPPGAIVDFNSVVLAGQVREWGATPTRLPITPDDRGLILERVLAALEAHDVVLVNAGSSAGSEDYTAGIVTELGELLVHGVAIRPGHPLILGVARGKALLGIPGYPVSAILTSELFLRPLLYHLQGLSPPIRPTVQATVTRKLVSPMGEQEYVRVKLGQVGERLIATPLSRGAGLIMSMVRADGLGQIPRFSEGLLAGAELEVQLLRSLDEIRQTIVAIGSHDLALDLASNALARRQPGASLASANVGSLGGLLALARGEAHLAGAHLLDEQTGEYNVSYIERYLAGRQVVVLQLAGRVQGLIVPSGNPKQLAGLADLARRDVLFVNRQRGSGTRVLLDYQLRQLGLTSTEIQGYAREEYTHLAVAADVASGAADVGLGILAAARALDLEFVPLFNEQYQLVVPREHYESDLLGPLLAIVRGPEFRAEVDALGGYDVAEMGKVVWDSRH